MRWTCLCLFLLGCDHFYYVRGRVTHCGDRQPVPGAIVALRYDNEFGATQTDNFGQYDVAVNDPPNDRKGELVVAAPGYFLGVKTVHHSTKESQDVCLQREEGLRPGDAPPAIDASRDRRGSDPATLRRTQDNRPSARRTNVRAGEAAKRASSSRTSL